MRSIALFTVFFTAFLITANAHGYVQSLRLSVVAWHIFIPVIPLHLLLAVFMGYLHKPDRATVLYYLWWLIFFFVVGMSIVFVDGGNAALAEATRYATFAGIGLSFLAVVQSRAFAVAGALGIASATLVAAGTSFAEFLDPNFTMIVDQLFEYNAIKEDTIGRSGGLHINPNSNARFMTLGMFVSCFFLQNKFRLVFCVIVGAAVLTTVSRSGLMTWALAIVMLFALGQFSKDRVHAKFIGFFIVATLGLLLSTGQIPKLIVALGLDGYMSEAMIERVSTGFFNQEDGSSSVRKALIPLAIDMYANNPILGAGLGGSRSLGDTELGSHNTVLQIAAEMGTLGLLCYLGLFLIPLILKSKNGFYFCVLFTFSAMFAHGTMYQTSLAFIFPVGLVFLSKSDHTASQFSKSNPRRRRRRKRTQSNNGNHLPSANA